MKEKKTDKRKIKLKYHSSTICIKRKIREEMVNKSL